MMFQELFSRIRYDGAEIIGGLPFARLEDVLTFKRSYGRPKDLIHARLIEKHLRDGAP